MRLQDLTQGRCIPEASTYMCLMTGNVVQVEAMHTIWDLLKGNKLTGGQEKDVCIYKDQGKLCQDQYTLCTAPQFLGPQIEDVILALNAVIVECNLSMRCLFSTLFSLTIVPCIATDNPLFNGEMGKVTVSGQYIQPKQDFTCSIKWPDYVNLSHLCLPWCWHSGPCWPQ